MKRAPHSPTSVTASEFAQFCGVSSQTVTRLIAAGLPHVRVGKGARGRVRIDPRRALPWMVAHQVSPRSERERLTKEQADKFAIENARARGEIVLVGQVADVLARLDADLQAVHAPLPDRLAIEFAGIRDAAVIRARLLEETRHVRAALADSIVKMADRFSLGG